MKNIKNIRKCLDPTCPCQDGDVCHYESYKDTKAMPIPEKYMIQGRKYENKNEGPPQE